MQVIDWYARDVAQTRLSDTEMRAWQALLHAYHQVIRKLDRDLREEHDLPLAAYDVLLRLAKAPDRALRMTDLAERVMLSPSGVTRLVDRLVTKGMVQRRADPDDARGALASLTDEGLRQLRSAARTHLRGIRDQFTGRLSEAQLRNVASGLETITGTHAPH
ncbi:MAG TPA: MarR family transcriptional regulator [Actinomycetota bacterium]|nr:MarR family transcriptional regulator [Actinomycetota bacterium]